MAAAFAGNIWVELDTGVLHMGRLTPVILRAMCAMRPCLISAGSSPSHPITPMLRPSQGPKAYLLRCPVGESRSTPLLAVPAKLLSFWIWARELSLFLSIVDRSLTLQ